MLSLEARACKFDHALDEVLHLGLERPSCRIGGQQRNSRQGAVTNARQRGRRIGPVASDLDQQLFIWYIQLIQADLRAERIGPRKIGRRLDSLLERRVFGDNTLDKLRRHSIH